MIPEDLFEPEEEEVPSSPVNGVIKFNSVNPFRPPKLSGHKIVRWRPHYDMIIAGHIMGKTDRQLAEEWNCSSLTISNIRHSPRGQELIAEAHARLRSQSIDSALTPIQRMEEIKVKAVEHMHDFINNQELARKSPFAFIKEVREIAKGAGALANGPSTVINNNIQQNSVTALGDSALSRLSNALAESQQIDERYRVKTPDERGTEQAPGGGREEARVVNE